MFDLNKLIQFYAKYFILACFALLFIMCVSAIKQEVIDLFGLESTAPQTTNKP